MSAVTAKPLPPVERLRALFEYDPETGVLTWRVRPSSDFATLRAFSVWNARYAGTRAGNDDSKGHRQVSIDKLTYPEHRVSWCIATGKCDCEAIDHIDQDGMNNRLENLREASVAINAKNMRRSCKNVSGTTGVFWNTQKQRWTATIGSFRKGYDGRHLGFYRNIEDAIAARKAAEIEMGYHPNHGRAA